MKQMPARKIFQEVTHESNWTAQPAPVDGEKYRDIAGTECHIWKHGKTYGYGVLHLAGKTERVHRLAWEEFTGSAPGTQHVLHKCDQRACINPQHLFLGTNADNMRDKTVKGRGKPGFTPGHQLTPSGEDHSRAKFSDELIEAVRSADGTHREIAKRFGVSKSHVGVIKLGRARATPKPGAEK